MDTAAIIGSIAGAVVAVLTAFGAGIKWMLNRQDAKDSAVRDDHKEQMHSILATFSAEMGAERSSCDSRWAQHHAQAAANHAEVMAALRSQQPAQVQVTGATLTPVQPPPGLTDAGSVLKR